MPASIKIKLGIVIPVKNCLQYTKLTIASICSKYPYQIYVVDDQSDPPTKEWLAAQDDLICFTDPKDSTGLAANWNLGVAAALQDQCTHIAILNNDILLHRNCLDLMIRRFDEDDDVILVSGHDVHDYCSEPTDVFRMKPDAMDIKHCGCCPGENEDYQECEHPHFSCFLISEDTIRHAGWFDECYYRAYTEDNDYHAAVSMSGYRAVKIKSALFYHYGSRTVAENVIWHDDRNEPNLEYFCRKWGRYPTNEVREMRETYYAAPFNRGVSLKQKQNTAGDWADNLFRRSVNNESDFHEHLDYISRIAGTIDDITLLLDNNTNALAGFLKAKPKVLRVYDQQEDPLYVKARQVMKLIGKSFEHYTESSLATDIEGTDLLFIDTRHIREQMAHDLERFAPKARRFLVMHDTEVFGDHGDTDGHDGIWPAISEYMREHPEWRFLHHFKNNNGLTVFARAC